MMRDFRWRGSSLTEEVYKSNGPIFSLIRLLVVIHKFNVIDLWLYEDYWNEIRKFSGEGHLGGTIRKRFVANGILEK